jgi:hypothetical protein
VLIIFGCIFVQTEECNAMNDLRMLT